MVQTRNIRYVLAIIVLFATGFIGAKTTTQMGKADSVEECQYEYDVCVYEGYGCRDTYQSIESNCDSLPGGDCMSYDPCPEDVVD